MKKILTLILILGSVLIFAACQPKVSLTIAEEDQTVSLTVGESVTIQPSVTEGYDLSWESNNESIVTVSNGTIVAVAAGSTTVVVSVVGYELSATITVTVVLPNANSVSIEGAGNVIVGETLQLIGTVFPSNALQTLTWSSSNTSVATVSNTGLVAAAGVGSAVITATSHISTVKVEVTITVVLPDPTTVTITGPDQVTVTETITLSATVAPELAAQGVTWSVNNESRATITTEGVLTGVSAGVVTVSATSVALNTVIGTKQVTVVLPNPTEVTVSGADEVMVGSTITLTAAVLPTLANQAVTWSVNDQTKATITAGGVLSGVAAGNVTVTATSVALNTIVGTKVVEVKVPMPTSVTVSGSTTINVDETVTLTALVAPQHALQDVTWSVDDTDVATITNDGVLTGVSEGIVVVTATSVADNQVLGQLTISVVHIIEFILLDSNLVDIDDNYPVTYRNRTYTKGIDAFASIADLNGKITNGTTIVVVAGTYSGGLTINKNNVSIFGPNRDLDPNTETRLPEAILTGLIQLEEGVQNFEINGVKLTAAGQIAGPLTANIDGVTIAYLVVEGTSIDSSQGVIFFKSNADTALNQNIVVQNSFFGPDTTDTRMVRGSNIFNLSLLNNRFMGAFDIIRLMGTNETNSAGIGIGGEFIVDGNFFTGAKQFVMFATRYNFSYFQMTNNTFKDMAHPSYGGIIDARAFHDTVESVEVVVKYNVFDNVFDWHLLRFTANARTIDTWKADVNYNAFIGTPGGATYGYVRITSTISAPLANVEYNYFAGTGDTPYTPTPENFLNVSSYANAFSSLNDLQAGIAYSKLADTPDDVLLVGNASLVPGKTVYATIADALVAANAGDTILLLPGVHAGNVTINKNNITITSLNAAMNPNETNERFLEAEMTGTITLAKALVGFKISGILFTGDAQILNTLGDVGTATVTTKNLDGFEFSNNIVETNLASGKGFIYFVEASSCYSYDLVFKHNYFTSTNAETTLSAIVYIDNHNHLTVLENVFENVQNDAFYIFDTTKGMSGNTKVQSNSFINIEGSAFWANWLSPLPTTQGLVEIYNNTFDSVGGYAIYLAKMNNTDIYQGIKIYYNSFTNVNVGIFFMRVHANANITVYYNKFMSVANTYYIENATDSTTASPSMLDAIDNLYMSEGLVITPDAAKFVGSMATATTYTSESEVPVFAEEGEILVTDLQIKPIATRLFVGDTYQLELEFTPEDTNTREVIWISSDTNVATINANGLVTCVGLGNVTFTATSVRRPVLEATVTVEVEEYSDVEIMHDGSGVISVSGTTQLSVVSYPGGNSATATYLSLNPTIATVNETGLVTGVGLGEAVIQVSVGGTIVGTMTIVVHSSSVLEVDPLQFIIDAHIASVLAQKVTTFGAITKVEMTYGAISYLWLNNIAITESIIPVGNSRPGTLLNSVEFIVVHDTGNNAAGATAGMHDSYLRNNDPGVSWHYTVDQNGAFQHLPLNEVGYHAGDGLRPFGLNDTGVTATTAKPVITISVDGYYELNGVKSTVAAPLIDGAIATTNKITPSGIFTTIGTNGNYYINNTYYNTTYKVISNQGGGTNGIGIESCVNEGADLFATWQNLSDLVSDLLIANDLGLDRVMQHNNFSGKNCPQTLRMSDLYGYFMTMVAYQYEMKTTFSDYQFSFESNNPTLVNDFGKVISRPKLTTEVSYTVTITGPSGYNETITLFSMIPGYKTLS